MTRTLGVIAGTGLYSIDVMVNKAEQIVESRYGDVAVQTGEYNGVRLIFVARHGKDHSLPPHMLNTKANVTALKELGAKEVISLNVIVFKDTRKKDLE